MSGKKKEKKDPDLFGSIRKPTAPPSQRHGSDRRDDKLDPVERKVKHKKKLPEKEMENDVP